MRRPKAYIHPQNDLEAPKPRAVYAPLGDDATGPEYERANADLDEYQVVADAHGSQNEEVALSRARHEVHSE